MGTEAEIDVNEINFEDLSTDAENTVDEETSQEGEEETLHPDVEKALAKGWVPQDEWEGDPEDWVDFREFNFRGELMEKISSQTKSLRKASGEIENLKSTMSKLVEHSKSLAEKSYKKALRDLQEQKMMAIEDRDFQAVNDIDEQIEELKTAQNSTKDIEENKEEDDTGNVSEYAKDFASDFQDWFSTEDAKWYREDVALRGAADAIANTYLAEKGEVPFDEVIAYVNKAIEKLKPANGKTRRKPVSTTVDPSINKNTKNKRANKYTMNDLSPEQQKMAREFERSAGLSVEEYIQQLVDMGELG